MAERFGVSRFRPGQRQGREAVLAGRNVLGIMPTGTGKSLCYQLPAMFLKKPVVVVSPLMALISLREVRLPVLSFESAKSARLPFKGECFQGEHQMSLQHVDYSSIAYPPQVIFAKGGGNQGGQAATKPKKSSKKPSKGGKKK